MLVKYVVSGSLLGLTPPTPLPRHDRAHMRRLRAEYRTPGSVRLFGSQLICDRQQYFFPGSRFPRSFPPFGAGVSGTLGYAYLDVPADSARLFGRWYLIGPTFRPKKNSSRRHLDVNGSAGGGHGPGWWEERRGGGER